MKSIENKLLVSKTVMVDIFYRQIVNQESTGLTFRYETLQAMVK